MHEVLVNRLRGLSLPRKSVVRLTDRPDIAIDVYCGRKTTMQQQQLFYCGYVCMFISPRYDRVNDDNSGIIFLILENIETPSVI